MANITRFNPFDDFFGDFGKGFWMKPVGFPAESELRMKVDVKEDETSFTVSAEIPGVKKEDIQVEIDGDQVTIRAESRRETEAKEGTEWLRRERRYGKAERRFALPAEVDEATATAKLADGVLELVLPKKAPAASRKITVN